MKNIVLYLVLFCCCFAANAQPGTAVIKQGTTVSYTLRLHGQQVAFSVTLTHLADSVILDWKMRNTTTGRYIVLPNAVTKGNSLNFVQPQPDETITLPNKQTFMFISKAAFKNLLQKHNFEYDNTVYELKGEGKASTITADGKVFDVLHVAAKNETTEFWILNNPALPLICRITGNPLGVDVELNSIK